MSETRYRFGTIELVLRADDRQPRILGTKVFPLSDVAGEDLEAERIAPAMLRAFESVVDQAQHTLCLYGAQGVLEAIGE